MRMFRRLAVAAAGASLLLAPLRTGAVRWLTFHLEKALTAGDLDPLGQHLLAFAQQAAA